ncbi:unnamed protein product [Coregonus sp. 'balchen']|nr:unnamed protein product [Coregonus sp. 'balchen']
MVRTVAVIGAGPSGLTSIKSCLDEGLEPTCFESSEDIGGLWRFKEHPDPGRANIYQSVIINSSKEMMSYSDFPPPAHLPNNMHHSQLLIYLRLYAENFDLFKHILFQTTVVSVRQRPDFPVSGQWEVETERTEGQRETQVFDAVMVCTGHFTRPHLPLNDFPGIEEFEGRYLHSWEYRSAEGLQGKKVVVVGIGNSGGDIAVDASRVAEQHAEGGMGGQQGGGRGPSREIRGSSVVFEDGSVVDKVDVVVFATGYNYDFPFLPSGLLANSSHRLCLYRHVFPLGLARPSLAVVGFICNMGAINPLAEMQARWATRVFKGLLTLPSEEAMLQDIKRDTSTLQNRFACLERHPLQVDHIPYLDSMAEELGVRPNLLGLLLREPGVGLRVLLGPCTPYQYRLRGPGQWDGARQAILTQWERVAQPFRTRMAPEPESRTRASCSLRLILTLSGAVLLLTLYTRHSLLSLLSHPTGLLYKMYSLPETISGWK